VPMVSQAAQSYGWVHTIINPWLWIRR
jgi:hypothetical protein